MDEQKVINTFQAIINIHFMKLNKMDKSEWINFLKSHYENKKKNKKKNKSYVEMLDNYSGLILSIEPTVTVESIKKVRKKQRDIKKRNNELYEKLQSKRYVKSFYSLPEWKELRENALKRDGYKCQKCGSKTGLHVHHKLGKRISNKLKDLVTVCKWCHKKYHPFMTVYTTKEDNLPLWDKDSFN